MTAVQTKSTIERAASEALRVITAAAADNVKTIALAAESAATVLANAAAEAVKVNSTRGVEDHDLLIELKVRMDGLRTDIKEIKTGTTANIDDHERRICDLELTRSAMAGSKSGIQDFWGWIVGGVMFIIALVSFLYPRIKL